MAHFGNLSVLQTHLCSKNTIIVVCLSDRLNGMNVSSDKGGTFEWLHIIMAIHPCDVISSFCYMFSHLK